MIVVLNCWVTAVTQIGAWPAYCGFHKIAQDSLTVKKCISNQHRKMIELLGGVMKAAITLKVSAQLRKLTSALRTVRENDASWPTSR
jgi:hypothetical protein